MKKRYLQAGIYTTILAVLAVPAVVAAQDRLTDVGLQIAPSRAIPSFGRAETRATLAPQSLITFYGTRASFNAAHPGLPCEDFQDFNDILHGCPAPANSTTSCVNGYNVGDILPGIEFTNDPGPNPLDGLVIVPTGFNGNASTQFGSNVFPDASVVNFVPPVVAFGVDVACHFGSPFVNVEVFDGNGVSVAFGNLSPCSGAGTFLGMDSSAPEGIGSVRIEDPTGVSAEVFDDACFSGPHFGDGFESGDTSAWSATVP